MTTPQELLFGQPINQIDNLTTVFENIYQTRDGSQMFAPNGLAGVPRGVTDPQSSINYLMNKRSIIERAAYQRPGVRLADKDYNIVGDLTLEMSLEFEELMTDSGTARYIVDWSNWLVDYMVNLTMVEEDLHLIIDPFPTKPDWRNRWGGKIHTINVKRNADGTNTVELLAVSNREHCKRLLIGANPMFAPEVQLPRMWILPGPVRSVLYLSTWVNLARLFVPGLSFVTNALNPFSWLDPLNVDAVNQVNPMDWPLQAAFVNTYLDDSDWTVFAAQWNSLHDSSLEILRDSGCMIQAYMWLTTDRDSPYTELVDMIKNDLLGSEQAVQNMQQTNPALARALMEDIESVVRPTRNCVILTFQDKSGTEGPTGTVFDGLLQILSVTLDDLISSVLINAQTGLTLDGQPVYDMQNNEFPIAESILGTAPDIPVVIWRDGTFSAQLESTHVLNKASPRTVMTGGRSPALVNQTQTFAIKWGLAQLQDLINPLIGSTDAGPFGLASNTAYQNPGTPGLQDLYQGQMDNVLMAWERVTQPLVAVWGGRGDFQEYFERGSSTAYTLSAFITLQTALWKTRAYHGFTAAILNGYPFTVGIDTVLGDRNGWELEDIIFVDQIYGIKHAVTRTTPLLTSLTIGENKDKEDPMARIVRGFQGLYTLFGAFLGEGTVFG